MSKIMKKLTIFILMLLDLLLYRDPYKNIVIGL